MDTPAIAIARCIWWRNRRSFIASAATLAVMAAFYPLLFAVSRVEWVLAASTLPLVAVFALVWNGLLFVEEPGNMSSNYPWHMLTLPVRTLTLVLWPFVLSCTIVALLWAVTAVLIYNTSGFAVPILLPAIGCAAMMAWLQVLSWTPIARQWIRLIVTFLVLEVLAACPMYLVTLPDRSSVWVGLMFIGYIAAAFPVGLAAVASQRRGDFWRVWPQLRLPRVMAEWPAHYRQSRAFGSPTAAQFWCEWNCHGLVVPVYVGSVMLLIWGVLLAAGKQSSVMMGPIVGLLLGLPVVLAGAVGPGLGRFNPFWIKDRGVITFVAIRPLSSSQIVRAKFVVAARSALLTWAISLLVSVLWILLSDNLDRAIKLIRDILDMYPGRRAIVIIALANLLLPALIWKQMTDGFAAVLSGRRWIAAMPAWIYTAGVIVMVAVGLWAVNHAGRLSWLFFILSILVVLGAVMKGALAIVGFRSVLRSRLMTWRAVTAILGLWLVLTGCGIGLAALLLSMPAPSTPVSWPVLALGIGLFVPLVRFPVATLALEWNRHR
jgi:hypothetical protein